MQTEQQVDRMIRIQQDTIKDLRKIIRSQNEQLEKQAAQLAALNQTIANLNETIDYMKKQMFGPKSEKRKSSDVNPGQISIFDFFDEAEFTADPNVPEPTVETVVREHTRKSRKPKATREEILKGLPIQEVITPVGAQDRRCPYCNTEMEVIGRKFEREEIVIIPAQVIRIHHYKEVMGCPACRKDGASVIVEAKCPKGLMKHSLASPSAVAYIILQKYVYGVPLYRQEASWEQDGILLSRATMANWIIKCYEICFKYLWIHMREQLLERGVIHADETRCQVLKEEGKSPSSRSYMWVYGSGNDGLPPIRMYDYRPSRGGYNAEEFLKGFEGYLICDGYSGYNRLKKVTRCGCLAHMRRYWYDALPGKSKKSSTPTPAEIGFDYCNRLFDLEKIYKGLDPEERKARRLETEPPIWEAYWSWLETVNPQNGSRLAKAVTYARNQKPYMENYLKDGRVDISNNIAENIARPYVVGRKNFLFHDSVKGAEASAAIYSLVETAKKNGLSIFDYFKIVLGITQNRPDFMEDRVLLDRMMPWSKHMQKHCKGPADLE